MRHQNCCHQHSPEPVEPSRTEKAANAYIGLFVSCAFISFLSLTCLILALLNYQQGRPPSLYLTRLPTATLFTSIAAAAWGCCALPGDLAKARLQDRAAAARQEAKRQRRIARAGGL